MQVALFSDNSEAVRYDNGKLPVYIRHGFLSYYPNYAAVSHWHSDFEFIYILSGKMDFRVEDKVYTLHPGEGLCINSRRVHYGFSKQHEECEFLCILLHPMLLCGNGWTEEKLVVPLMNNSNYPCQRLFPDTDWQKRIMDELQNWFSSNDSKNFPPEMLGVITQNRKNRRIILGTSQNFYLLAKAIRSQATEVRRCSTFLGCLTIVRRAEPILDSEGNVAEWKL